MKFNWGTGAFMLFGGFVLMMLFFGYKASQQNIDLVTSDYYEKEMEFEDVQRKKNNTAKLKESIVWDIEGGNIIFNYPKVDSGPITGEIIFYKASDKIHDRQMDIEVNSENKQLIPLSNFTKGIYQLKIDWLMNDQAYFLEQRITIP